jgi:hypothetical protein
MSKPLTFAEVMKERQAQSIVISKRTEPIRKVPGELSRDERVALLHAIAKALPDSGPPARQRMSAHDVLDVHVRDVQKREPKLTREQAEASIYKRYPHLIDAIHAADGYHLQR